MSYVVGSLCIIGILLLVNALIGKEISFGEFKIPGAESGVGRAVYALLGVVALAAGVALFMRPNGLQGAQRPPSAAATGQPVTAPESVAPTAAQSTSGVSPVASSGSPGPATSSKADAAKPLYLSSLVGTTTGYSDSPDSGSRTLGSVTYPRSLSYDLGCEMQERVTYSFPGKYHYIVAKVGMTSPQAEDDGSYVRFEVDDLTENPIGAKDAKYGSPKDLRINIQGRTSISLFTHTYGCPGGTDAVWGDAELVP